MPTYSPVSNPFSSGDDFPSTDASVTLPPSTDAVYCDYPHKAEVGFKNIVTTSWSGKEKRAAQQPAKMKFTLAFEQLSHVDADTLWNHYLAQMGTLYSFTYYDYNSGESFTCRYAKDGMTRDNFLFEAEKTGIELIEVL